MFPVETNVGRFSISTKKICYSLLAFYVISVMDKNSYFKRADRLSCFFPLSHFCSLSSVSSPVFPFTVIKLQQLTKEIALDHNSFAVRHSPEISNTVELSMNKILILLSSLLLL